MYSVGSVQVYRFSFFTGERLYGRFMGEFSAWLAQWRRARNTGQKTIAGDRCRGSDRYNGGVAGNLGKEETNGGISVEFLSAR